MVRPRYCPPAPTAQGTHGQAYPQASQGETQMTATLLYALAALGAYRVIRRMVVIALWFWRTRNDKPTAWLMPHQGGSTQ